MVDMQRYLSLAFSYYPINILILIMIQAQKSQRPTCFRAISLLDSPAQIMDRFPFVVAKAYPISLGYKLTHW